MHNACIQDIKTVETVSGNPEFLRLPTRGADSIFGLTRSTWYNLEKRGVIRLRRLRSPGNVRGITLIPVEEARRAIEKETAT